MKPSQVVGKIAIGRPVAAVWEFIANPENYPDYVEGYVEGEMLTEKTSGVGMAFRWYAALGPLKIPSQEAVVKYEPPNLVAFAGHMMGIPFNSSMALAETGETASELTVRIAYTVPGWLLGSILDRTLIHSRVRSSVNHSLRKIKHHMEKTV